MRKHRTLWIAIADGEHARIVVPGAAAGSFRSQSNMDSVAAHEQSADLGTDKPGRSFESAGAARHAITPKSDPHTLEKRKFEHFVAERLNEASAQGAFDQLVLVAPTKAMPEIRDHLDHPTAAKLIGTLAKDLTKVPDHELGPHLADWERPAQQEGT